MAGSGDGSRGKGEDHYRRAVMFHPLRQRIARSLTGGREAGASELSAKLDRAPAQIAHHLRILTRRRVLKVVPRCRPARPLYRWSEDAKWAREMLIEEDE